jgi:hypothetical protein
MGVTNVKCTKSRRKMRIHILILEHDGY